MCLLEFMMHGCMLVTLGKAIVITSFVLGEYTSVEYHYLRAILELRETISWCCLQLGSFPYDPKLVAVVACFESLCTMPLLDI
jgi:hypothetical protein